MCRYLLSLDKNPVATKAVTSAVLTLAGDLICQVRLVINANTVLFTDLEYDIMQCSMDSVVMSWLTDEPWFQ
jgi:hypothetical protein